jgi:tetratricopeptide (TPR) repeat protein
MRYGLQDKNPFYKRDLLRDYCLVSAELGAQFSRFHTSGSLSFSIIQGIIGDNFSKGLLWRLKDTAHHLFDAGEAESRAGGENGSLEADSPGAALDWCIGFLFHKCFIIMEASYQLQKYYPAAKALNRPPLLAQASDVRQHLERLISGTEELLCSANRLFCEYLAGDKNNRQLARLIYDREALLRSVFKELYPELLRGIFGPSQEKAFLEAAWSLFEGGQAARAEKALRKALEINPDYAEAAALLKNIREGIRE